MAPPVRLSYNRYWNNFSPDIERLDLDFWSYANYTSLIPQMETTLSDFSAVNLHDDAKNFQLWSFTNELSDEKIANSHLGRELAKINVRIVAVIVRPALGVPQSKHLQCSLLLDRLN